MEKEDNYHQSRIPNVGAFLRVRPHQHQTLRFDVFVNDHGNWCARTKVRPTSMNWRQTNP